MTYRRAALSSLAEVALINVINLVLAGAILLAFRIALLDSFGLILLAEGAGLLLVGGALGFAGQPGIRRVATTLGQGSRKKPGSEADEIQAVRRHDIRAAFYMLSGSFLFLESMFLAVLFTIVL